MIQETIPPEYEMDDQELAEFERDYARWCLEVELDQICIVDTDGEAVTKIFEQYGLVRNQEVFKEATK